MKKLNSKGIKVLKLFHIVLSAMWLGGAIGVTLLTFMRSHYSEDVVLGLYTAMKLVDDVVITPGAMGAAITGLIYSIFTGWGFFKHKWITLKWAITILQIILGAGFLARWVNSNYALLHEKAFALTNTVFLQNENMIKVVGLVQITLILVLMILSILKPFSVNQARSGNNTEYQQEQI